MSKEPDPFSPTYDSTLFSILLLLRCSLHSPESIFYTTKTTENPTIPEGYQLAICQQYPFLQMIFSWNYIEGKLVWPSFRTTFKISKKNRAEHCQYWQDVQWHEFGYSFYLQDWTLSILAGRSMAWIWLQLLFAGLNTVNIGRMFNGMHLATASICGRSEFGPRTMFFQITKH
jgi:hypothetical protein